MRPRVGGSEVAIRSGRTSRPGHAGRRCRCRRPSPPPSPAGRAGRAAYRRWCRTAARRRRRGVVTTSPAGDPPDPSTPGRTTAGDSHHRLGRHGNRRQAAARLTGSGAPVAMEAAAVAGRARRLVQDGRRGHRAEERRRDVDDCTLSFRQAAPEPSMASTATSPEQVRPPGRRRVARPPGRVNGGRGPRMMLGHSAAAIDRRRAGRAGRDDRPHEADQRSPARPGRRRPARGRRAATRRPRPGRGAGRPRRLQPLPRRAPWAAETANAGAR